MKKERTKKSDVNKATIVMLAEMLRQEYELILIIKKNK